jgi:hypothetical protein
MSTVTFLPDLFKARYPEFATVSNDLLQLYFNEACLYLDNTTTSRIVDLTERQLLLWFLTAHIAKINGSGSGAIGAGRVNTATEGTISVGFEFSPSKGGLMAWLYQTQYGTSYWAATARYRTMRYATEWQAV